MYPKGCHSSYTNGTLRVFGNGRLIDSITGYDIDYYSTVTNGTWAAGNYSVFFKPTWATNDVQDYTVRAYFPTAVTLVRTDFASDTAAQSDMSKFNQASKLILL
jgi:hypothetical protein